MTYPTCNGPLVKPARLGFVAHFAACFRLLEGSEEFAINVRKNLLSYLALLLLIASIPVLLLVVIARVIGKIEQLIGVRFKALAKLSRLLEPCLAHKCSTNIYLYKFSLNSFR